MINFLLITLHVLACLFLIVFVLLQAGKNADLAGAFGGSASQTAFGNRATGNFLTRMTTVMAVVFMVTCLVLSLRYNANYAAGSSSIPVQDGSAPAAAAPATLPSVPAPAAVPSAKPEQSTVTTIPAKN